MGGSWVFPAHAGMDRLGDDRLDLVLGCSPHTRGWTGRCPEPGAEAAGVFPAHAGMDRMGGGYGGDSDQCSPHTRGWTGNVHCKSRK